MPGGFPPDLGERIPRELLGAGWVKTGQAIVLLFHCFTVLTGAIDVVFL